MSISSVITTEALDQIQRAQNNNGWYLYPVRFGVSETAGALSITRTIDTVNPQFYEGLISSRVVESETDIKFNTEIPPGLPGGTKNVAEFYLFARGNLFAFSVDTGTNIVTIPTDLWNELVDGDGIYVESNGTLPAPLSSTTIYYAKKEVTSGEIKLYADKALTSLIDITSVGSGSNEIAFQFLLSIGQPSGALPYDPNAGAVRLFPTIRLASVDTVDLFQFNYTQAGEISDHNDDINAHPEVLGKTLIRNVTFDAAVDNLEAVYLNTDGNFYPALADGTIKEQNFAGVRQGNLIVFKGRVDAPAHGLTVGSQLFLSSTIAGDLTTTMSNLLVGLVLDADTLLIDRTLAGATINTTMLALTDTPGPYLANSFVKVNATGTGIVFSGAGISGNLEKYDTVAALKAVDQTVGTDDQFAFVVGEGIYRYYPSSTTVGDDKYRITPTLGGGNWILEIAQFEQQQLLVGQAVGAVHGRVDNLVQENINLKNRVAELEAIVVDFESRIFALENP
jgi:hypothetical protein